MNTRRTLGLAGAMALALGLVLAVIGLRGISADMDALGSGSQIVLGRDGNLSEGSGFGHFLLAVLGAVLLVLGLALLNTGLLSRRRPLTSSITCPACARDNAPAAHFCDGCGYSFSTETA